MGLQTHQLPLRVQSTTECLFIRDHLPLLGRLPDRQKQPPHEDGMFLYFLLLLISFLLLLFFSPSLLLVGRGRIRCRCGRGRTNIAGVSYGRVHGRHGCGHVRDHGRPWPCRHSNVHSVVAW